MLCQKCLHAEFVDGGSGTTYRSYQHSLNVAAVEQSADRGCHFCQLLEHALKYSEGPFEIRGGVSRCPTNEPVEIFHYHPDTASDGQPSRLIVRCGKRDIQLMRRQMPDALKEFSDVGHDPSDSSTGSLRSLRLAGRWLQRCLAEHSDCTAYCGPAPPPLPTRVLDVGAEGSDRVKLYVTNSKHANYVSLSHCWGSSPTFTTTSKNIQDRQAAILLSDLPVTFRHAVNITRSLGVSYLWIDSLCIIQDSSQDWELESSRMRDVYRRSICTISVARSKDSGGGCFSERNAISHRPVRLLLPRPDTGPIATKESLTETFWSAYRWQQPTGPLYERAWVFQEQALSGRNLAFGEDTIFWDCCSVQASDFDPVGERNLSSAVYGTFRTLVVNREKQHLASLPTVTNASKVQLYDTWYQMVGEYSQRAITYEADRLPALSALAEQMGQLVEDEYVAGLWKGDLVRGLMWCCNGTTGRRNRPPQKYVAPSWSWLSVHGTSINAEFGLKFRGGLHINGFTSLREIWAMDPAGDMTRDQWHDFLEKRIYGLNTEPDHHYNESDDLRILDIDCVSDGPSKFGRIGAGKLVVKGLVKPAKLRKQDTRHSTHPSNDRDDRATELLDLESGDSVGWLNCDEDPRFTQGDLTVWCLFWTWFIAPGESGGTSLVLVPTHREEEEFRRFGLAGCSSHFWSRGYHERTLSIV